MLDEKHLLTLVIDEYKAGNIKKKSLSKLLQFIQSQVNEEVAVVGMGCYLPGIDNYEELWQVISRNGNILDDCPDYRMNLTHRSLRRLGKPKKEKYRSGALFAKPDYFDYELFGFSQEEARYLDPTQRLILLAAYRTLEDAGYLGDRCQSERTAVIVGKNFTGEKMLSYLNLIGYKNYEATLLNWSSGLATRISHYFNLKGTAYTIDSSCVSCSQAIINAYEGIMNDHFESALVGGLTFYLIPDFTAGIQAVFEEPGVAQTRPFDENSQGMNLGEGAAMLLLKKRSQAEADGDRIHAILKGGAIGNSGQKVDFLGCSADEIAKAFTSAVALSRVNLAGLGSIEGEGFIDKVVESIHFNGLASGLSKYKLENMQVALGAHSPNFGYLEAAVTPLNSLKSILSLKHKMIPPLTNHQTVSSLIDIKDSPIYFNKEAKFFNVPADTKRLSANYGYGFGGNNAVIFYEEYPEQTRTNNIALDKDEEKILFLSAHTARSFQKLLAGYRRMLRESQVNLPDMTFTAAQGRKHYYQYRKAIVFTDQTDLYNKISDLRITFLRLNQRPTRKPGVKEQVNLGRKLKNAIAQKNLEEIARLYEKGANADFNPLFEDLDVRITSLPDYKFDMTSCWI